ncbi:dephospho-CoA kinase [Roseateles sp. GG27B]
MLRIGLTGGIGSGKSTVAGFWTEAGAAVIDVDAISRQLSAAGGAAMPRIAAEFGSASVAADGGLDRTRMRELAFADPSVRLRLEAILHPLIGAGTQAAAAVAAATGSDVIVFDVPLLVESGRWRARVDRVLVVDCNQDAQIERVQARSGWTREAVLAVLAQQASRSQRRACADAVINNENQGLAALRAQVLELAERWWQRL